MSPAAHSSQKEHLAGQQVPPLIRPVRACAYPRWADPFWDTTLGRHLHRTPEAREPSIKAPIITLEATITPAERRRPPSPAEERHRPARRSRAAERTQSNDGDRSYIDGVMDSPCQRARGKHNQHNPAPRCANTVCVCKQGHKVTVFIKTHVVSVQMSVHKRFFL